jgi:hypothetical protein
MLEEYLERYTPEISFGDFLTQEMIKSEDNIIYSAMKLDIMIKSIDEH